MVRPRPGQGLDADHPAFVDGPVGFPKDQTLGGFGELGETGDGEVFVVDVGVVFQLPRGLCRVRFE